jgi:flagellar protein FliS
MPTPNPYSKYPDVRFSTINKGNLVVMLYEGAIRFLEEAKNRMRVRDFAGKGMYIDRAFGAINELRGSLNFEAHEKLADSLNQLYFFMTKQISKASLSNDSKHLEIVIELLKGLKEAWEQAVKKENANNKTSKALA